MYVCVCVCVCVSSCVCVCVCVCAYVCLERISKRECHTNVLYVFIFTDTFQYIFSMLCLLKPILDGKKLFLFIFIP